MSASSPSSKSGAFRLQRELRSRHAPKGRGFRLESSITEMIGNGTHGKPVGTVTDDTDLALCIARSLVEQNEFDGQDIADRFVDWYESGPFDIGLMTADAITEYRSGTSWRDAGREVWQHRSEGSNAGNGSIMRCAPHALVFDDDWDRLIDVSKRSSAITHYDPRCTYGCAILNLVIAGFLHEDEFRLPAVLDYVESDAPDELVETLRLVPEQVDNDQLQTTGYVLHTLQTALYDVLTTDSAEEAIVRSVNRGGDTDTTGAVTGALAGARFGAGALPDRWLSAIEHRDELAALGGHLATLSVD